MGPTDPDPRRRRPSRAKIAARIACLALCLLGAAAPQARASHTVAAVTANVPISGYGGWLVWSVRAGTGWGINALHAGKVAALPVARRDQPFDLNLGTDSTGRTVVTFSRCATSPGLDPEGRTAPWTGAGCHVDALDVLTGHETVLQIPHPKGSSDTTPSMWMGDVAFARRDPAHGEVSQVLLYNHHTHKLRTLLHGAFPMDCPHCRGAVQGLDFKSRLVSFLWWIDTEPKVSLGQGYWEVRADSLPTGASALIDSGFVGEACTGNADLVVPAVPSSAGNRVFYSDYVSTCYQVEVTLVDAAPIGKSASVGTLAAEALQIAKAGSSVYALVAGSAYQAFPSCDPCTIEQVDLPPLKPILGQATEPF